MIQTIIKHKIYESCIELFFDGLMRNFPIKKRPPKPGEFYSKVIDHEVDDVFYNCTFMRVQDMQYYEEMKEMKEKYEENGEYIDVIAIAMRYEKCVDSEGDVFTAEDLGDDEYQETSYTYRELPYLECIR